MIEAIIAAVVGSYGVLIVYLFERLRKLRKLSPEERRKMTRTQRLLYLYGFYRFPSVDLQSSASRAFSELRSSWQDMENIFQQFERAFEQKKNQLQQTEKHLTDLEQRVQQQTHRLQALSQLTPEAAREVSATIESSSLKTLRQQVIVSAVFFVLGVVTTLGITLAVI